MNVEDRIDKDKKRILVVDDEPHFVDVLVGLLRTHYHVSVALSGKQALQRASCQPLPDLILLDVFMPKEDGFLICKQLKQAEVTRHIPVIFLTGENNPDTERRGFDMGAVDYVTKPISPPTLKARIRTHLLLQRAFQDLEDKNRKLEELAGRYISEIEKTQDAAILSLTSVLGTRDSETGNHIRRTQEYIRELAIYLKDHYRFSDFLTPENIDLLYKSAPLHDIGKVGIPDRILLKPGKLSKDEFDEMKKHTIYGRDAILCAEKSLGSNSFLRIAREIAFTHQEKWDGSGYPQGLMGDDIPVSGRLMAMADVYDALISKRAYKKPFSHEDATEYICNQKHLHFDPDIVDAFLALSDRFNEIARTFIDDD